MGIVLKEMSSEMQCYGNDTGWGMILEWEVR